MQKNKSQDKINSLENEQNSGPFRERFESSLEELSKVRGFIIECCKKNAISDQFFIVEIELCLHEALTNIIKHGYQGEKDKPIVIECQGSSEGLIVDIYDQGIAFSPTLAHISMDNPVAESGRGLFMMHILADVVQFNPKKGAEMWNRLHIVKLIAQTKKE